MLDYTRQRAIELLKIPHKAFLATDGPTGLQAGEFPCEACGLELYLLVPGTCDHLINLEQNPDVILLCSAWEMRGKAQIQEHEAPHSNIALANQPDARWCRLVRVSPRQMHIRREAGWGYTETLELNLF
jgi:hypothetical protein